ncbi:MAG: hypothetical protein ACI9JL_000512 [Paracoccaceae bacterium]|jgi:hypothetical protein
MSRRKVRERSVALLLLGVAFLMPPIAGISLIDSDIGGIPVPMVYLFAIWALLIVGAAALARGLRDSGDSSSTTRPPGAPD